MIKSLNKFVLKSNYDSNNSQLFSKIITILALINIFAVLPDIFTIYSKYGFFDEELNKHIISPNTIFINEISNILLSLGIKYEFAFISIFLIYIISLIAVLFNYSRLFFSIIIVFLHTVFINSSDFLCYGADYMISFLLYINIFFCIEKYVSKENFNLIFSFTIRLVQIQLCVIYFFGGFGKILGYDWYTGDAVWLSLNHYMNESVLNLVSKYTPKFVYQFVSIHILLIELFYPILVYFKKTRKWVIIDIIVLHVGISIMIGLHTFSLAMIILNLLAFYPNKLVTFYNYINEKICNFFNFKYNILEK